MTQQQPAQRTAHFQTLLSAVVGALLYGSILLPVFGLDFEHLQEALTARFGPSSALVFKEWKKLVGTGTNLQDVDKLKRVNNFFNQNIQFNDDITIWGQSDYWATPLETMGKGQGDCEDISIAKYYSLMEMGIPISKLRLVYVKARQNTGSGPALQAHMVLAYYPKPAADPLILDNLEREIRPASARTDLTPIFSFNSDGLWLGTGNQTGKSSLSRWQDLLQRARSDGFQ